MPYTPIIHDPTNAPGTGASINTIDISEFELAL